MITLSQQPAAYTPYINPQTFTGLSNQLANPDFMYRVICTDIITSESQRYSIKPRPVNGKLVFPTQNFSKNYIEHFVPNNQYGFQPCVDSIRKINVEFREYYGGNEVAASPPNDEEFIIWNAALRTLEWVDFDYTDYVYNALTSNFKYLSSFESDGAYQNGEGVTYEDTSHFLYVLTSQAGDLQTIRINTYDENDNLIGTSDIANPYEASTTYTDKYLAIDVGPKGLDGLTAFQVSGTYPVLSDSVAWYEVQDVTIAGSPPATVITNIKKLTIGCEPTFPVYSLHYKARKGNFETLHCNKMSTLTEEIEKTNFRVNPNTLSSTEYSYTKFSQWAKNLSSVGTDTLLLNSDWLTTEQVEAHREIIGSPLVYIDYGSVTGLVPCEVLDRTILVNKDHNDPLYGIALNVRPTYKNTYG